MELHLVYKPTVRIEEVDGDNTLTLVLPLDGEPDERWAAFFGEEVKLFEEDPVRGIALDSSRIVVQVDPKADLHVWPGHAPSGRAEKFVGTLNAIAHAVSTANVLWAESEEGEARLGRPIEELIDRWWPSRPR